MSKSYFKTQRQNKEYNKLLGFLTIKDEYEQCLTKLNKKGVKIDEVNTHFLKSVNRCKTKYRISMNNNNIYERKWKQEYNKLKKNIKNKLCIENVYKL